MTPPSQYEPDSTYQKPILSAATRLYLSTLFHVPPTQNRNNTTDGINGLCWFHRLCWVQFDLCSHLTSKTKPGCAVLLVVQGPAQAPCDRKFFPWWSCHLCAYSSPGSRMSPHWSRWLTFPQWFLNEVKTTQPNEPSCPNLLMCPVSCSCMQGQALSRWRGKKKQWCKQQTNRVISFSLSWVVPKSDPRILLENMQVF